MIPSDHISFNTDGTAWWSMRGDVQGIGGEDVVIWELDRPCDNCGGTGGDGGYAAGIYEFPCELCDGWGRHTFDVEVEEIGEAYGSQGFVEYADTHIHRVSVVPSMVLPIVAWGQRGDSTPPYLVTQLPRPMATLVTADRIAKTTISLPPAARPGMWAIQLRKADR